MVPEHEVFAWSAFTTNGKFISVCSIPEGNANAVYVVVQRIINGQTVNFIERFAYRIFDSIQNSWCVDCALQYTNVTPFTVVTGLDYLEGMAVTGLIDGVPFNATVAGGSITLNQPTNNIIVGLGFTCDLKTLRIDLGEPTVQGRRKSIPALTIRFKDSLNVKAGHDFDQLETLRFASPFAVPQQPITGDIRKIIGSSWDTLGQLAIRQDTPCPATILGVIPEVVIGDTGR